MNHGIEYLPTALRRIALALACGASAVAFEDPWSHAKPPEPTDLGTLGGNWSEAEYINDRGDVVGPSLNADGNMRPFFVATRGPQAFKMIDLGTLGGERQDTWTMAMAVNNALLIVGHAPLSSGQIHAWAKPPGMPMRDLGTLDGHTDSAALGVNDLGIIVGWSGNGLDCADQKPAVWLPDFRARTWKPQALDTAGFSELPCWQPWKINTVGQIVGRGNDAQGAPYAFLWNPNLFTHSWTAVKLDAPEGYPLTWANGINDRGEIAGVAVKEDWSVGVAVLWTPDQPFRKHYRATVLRNLTNQPGDWAGASGINQRGDIVGFSSDADGVEVGVLWPAGKDRRPVSLGMATGGAWSVNNAGLAVGGGLTTDKSEYHALLAPTR